jgi:hypothetical protein
MRRCPFLTEWLLTLSRSDGRSGPRRAALPGIAAHSKARSVEETCSEVRVSVHIEERSKVRVSHIDGDRAGRL